MTLGISYNVFDGVELLEASIDSVRASADYICVVYQTVSNMGNEIPIDVESVVLRLKSLGKINEVHKYTPPKIGGHVNEVNKRNRGLDLVRAAGCTHFMTVDVDELYDADELNLAKRLVFDNGFDSSGCKMLTYYRSGEFIIDPPEEYYVPLIYKVDSRILSMGAKWPVPADPTRRMNPGKLRLFERDEIQMHHFSYVRNDLRTKLVNSSASGNFSGRIDKIVQYYDNWQFGQQGLLAGREERLYDIKRVENKFNIKDHAN